VELPASDTKGFKKKDDGNVCVLHHLLPQDKMCY